jgi:microsomal epoxide hydrolase
MRPVHRLLTVIELCQCPVKDPETTSLKMPQPFSAVPTGAGSLKPFELRIPEDEITRFKALLALSHISPETWENRQEDGRYGVSRAWLIKAQDVWLHSFNWRLQEARINAVPNFYATVTDERCGRFKVHFAALFSTREDAIPIVFLHGWPGSFLEFLPILTLLKNKYKPDTLPYHVVVPSLPGFAFSTGPPVDQSFGNKDCPRIIDGLMQHLGFGKGYVAQGGDYGALLCNALSSDTFPSCKAQHGESVVLPVVSQAFT